MPMPPKREREKKKRKKQPKHSRFALPWPNLPIRCMHPVPPQGGSNVSQCQQTTLFFPLRTCMLYHPFCDFVFVLNSWEEKQFLSDGGCFMGNEAFFGFFLPGLVIVVSCPVPKIFLQRRCGLGKLVTYGTACAWRWR